jgi:phage FluMu protein gp41
MTVVADNKKRVTIRLAKPGDRFDVQVAGAGKFVLTRLKPIRHPRPAKVRIEKRGSYSVGVVDSPVSEAAIKEVLSQFP